MYVLYQIGDISLYDALLGYDGDPVEASLSYKWENPSTEFQSPGGRQYHGPMTRSIPAAIEFELKGRLFATPYINVSRIKARLRAFGGRRGIPVIVYSFEENLDGCRPEIKWFIGYGTILEDSNEHEYHGADSAGSFISQDLNIEIELEEPFVQLSSWLWELRPMDQRLHDPYSDQAPYSGLNRFSHPRYINEIPKNHYFLRWQDPDTAYNPDFWEVQRLYEMSYGGQASGFVDTPYTTFVFANEDIWTIAPRALYAFTGLSPLGSLTIETELKTGLFFNDKFSTESTLDLVQLDADLAAIGYGGLFIDDVIYAGASRPRPGFVKRNGITIAGLRPKWSYEYAYPGEIPLGASWIRITPYLTDAQVAYSIDFRTS